MMLEPLLDKGEGVAILVPDRPRKSVFPSAKVVDRP